MADILLTHCNHLYYDQKQVRKMQPYPPLQTIIAAAHLREAGFVVALFDATLNAPEQGFRAALTRHRPGLVILCEDNFNYLTKMCLKRNRQLAFAMAGIARQQNIPIAVSSSDASDRAWEYASHGVDVAVIGEPEHTLVDLARHRLGLGSGDLSQVPGLAYVDPRNGGVCYTTPRQAETDLSRFPMPAWDLVDIDSYRDAWMKAHGHFCLNLISSRGCPYNCNWCAKPIYGQTYRLVPARRAAEEMRLLKQKYNPDQIWFADDTFALSHQWTGEFAQALAEWGAQIPFRTQSRCDLMTEDTAADLQRAGCAEIWLGVESGSQRILDAMEKDICVREVYAARENLRRQGIRACFFLQFGYPGETWEDIQATIRMVRETAPNDVGISVSYPLPGSKFYSQVPADARSGQNWLESGDLSVTFHATYNNHFYALLHDALHLEVEMMNGRADPSASRAHLPALWSQLQQIESARGAYLRNIWTSC